jgi:hypothetical protein
MFEMQRRGEGGLHCAGGGRPEIIGVDQKAHKDRAAAEDIPRHSGGEGGGSLEETSHRGDEVRPAV